MKAAPLGAAFMFAKILLVNRAAILTDLLFIKVILAMIHSILAVISFYLAFIKWQ